MINEALSDINQAISLSPDEGYYYSNRGLAYSNLGEHKKALADFNRAIKLGRRDSFVYNYRGEEYSALGKLDQAQDNFERALKLDFISTTLCDNLDKYRLAN